MSYYDMMNSITKHITDKMEESVPQSRNEFSYSTDIKRSRNVRSIEEDIPLTFSTFSGADIKAFIPIVQDGDQVKNIPFLELQTISVSSHRATSPVYGLGSVATLGFTKGSRAIAGSMIVYQFLSGALEEIYNNSSSLWQNVNVSGLLLDQLPPFNIMIAYANEYGFYKYSFIAGVTFISQGDVLSIQDLTTERTLQYTALDYFPLSDEIKKMKEDENAISISSALKEAISGNSKRANPFLGNR